MAPDRTTVLTVPRAAARRTLLVVLLVLAALLGTSAAPSAAEPRPAATSAPDPAGESQQDGTETEAAAPALAPARARAAQRPAGGRAPRGDSHGAPSLPHPDRLPGSLLSLRTVVLRC
ncbi:hypothetical protein ABT160_43355 [Streptomyces sp. NPDC001941]|uniref:hypothetical protein n=1 Tax=Streptomyces sp. NPDC001941 TaxID=3154659 RepID=UPI003331D471